MGLGELSEIRWRKPLAPALDTGSPTVIHCCSEHLVKTTHPEWTDRASSPAACCADLLLPVPQPSNFQRPLGRSCTHVFPPRLWCHLLERAFSDYPGEGQGRGDLSSELSSPDLNVSSICGSLFPDSPILTYLLGVSVPFPYRNILLSSGISHRSPNMVNHSVSIH